MEMKDKLKKLRQDKGMTQAQLAEVLFVSRSAVAKWENGLGLPYPESMAALAQLFGTTAEEVATNEPEKVIVTKNRHLRRIGLAIGCAAFIMSIILIYLLPFAIYNGNYGFTAEMAAGIFADSPYIDTGDYRIYYSTFEGDQEDGRHWCSLATFKPVQKHFWGCTVSEEDYEYDTILQDGVFVGILYSIKGQNGYYNLIMSSPEIDAPDYIFTLETISI